MDTTARKKITVIQKYVIETFSDGDWITLGQLTESSEDITEHKRLLRSMHNGDDDYPYAVAEVIGGICARNENYIETIIEFYDIDLWYEQKDKAKYERIFKDRTPATAQFWKPGYVRVFITHLALSKAKATTLKEALLSWGMSSFVAHEDIEPTKEWMTEIELGLNTMDVLVAMVEPGFKDSNWTDQEVGFALGRKVEIVPMRLGADPHGFLGKYQGIAAKGRYAPDLAREILSVLLKKQRIRSKLISGLNLSFAAQGSTLKVSRIKEIDQLNILNQNEMKEILQGANLTLVERRMLSDLVAKYKAFLSETQDVPAVPTDDLPF